MRRSAIITALVISIIALATGCKRNELCYECSQETVPVEIKFVWDNDLIPPKDRPEGMYIYLYPSAGGDPILEFTDTYGGLIGVPYGKYSVILVGNNTQKVLFRGQDAYNTAEAYTQEVEGVMSEPDNLFVATADIFEVCASPDTLVFTEKPRNYVVTVPFTFSGIEGVEYLTRIRIYVSGLARSVFLASGKLSSLTGRVSPEYTIKPDGFEGNFKTFGYYDGSNVEHILTVQFFYAGQIITKTYDVTEMLDTTGRIDIIDVIKFDPVDNGNGGFDPGVGDWSQEDIEIPI